MRLISPLLLILLALQIGFSQAEERYKLFKYPDLDPDLTIYDILLRNDGSVYLATEKGLYFINSYEETPKQIIQDRRITALTESGDGSFFFAGDNMYGNSTDFKLIYLKDPTTKIQCLAIHEDNLWVGTNNGLYEINKRNFALSKHFTVKNSKLPDPFVKFLYSDRYNVLWAGTKNGVLRINGKSWKAYERHAMEGIFENREGLWLLSDKELWNIDNINKYNRWYPANLQDGLKKGAVNDIVIDSEDRLIIASQILVRFDPYFEKIERYGDDLGLISQNCLALDIDNTDRLWIGTENDGLYTVGFRERKRKVINEDKFIDEFSPLQAELIGKAPACNGFVDGSIKVNIEGGKPPYVIKWSTGKTDVQQVFNLGSGHYRVTVIDAQNDTINQRISLFEPRPLTIDIEELNIDEFNENNATATFAFDGGTPGYILSIDGMISPNPATGLNSGNHLAEVTDIMGCKASMEFEVEGETSFSQIDAANIRVGQVVRIDKLYFETDSTNIAGRAIPVLDDVYNFLTANPNIIIEVGGHTNGLPPHDYCDKLSTERAKNVAEHLIDRGIPTERINYKGYGKRVPVATNQTVEGRKRNQRVEIKILSLGN
jgi:outer membrane protein OmpA-like peptidoglycan-associated protein